MKPRLSYGTLAALLLGVALVLAWAAIELVPQTLFFPAVEYSMPGDIHFAMFKTGEVDRESCQRTASQISSSVRALCPACRYVERCSRGLSAEARKILSRDALETPSIRTRETGVTMTISAADPALAANVCQLIEQQSAAQPADERARCYPAFQSR